MQMTTERTPGLMPQRLKSNHLDPKGIKNKRELLIDFSGNLTPLQADAFKNTKHRRRGVKAGVGLFGGCIVVKDWLRFRVMKRNVWWKDLLNLISNFMIYMKLGLWKM